MALYDPAHAGLDRESLERKRYKKSWAAEDQRLWGPDEMMRKAVDVTFGLVPKGEKRFDIPPGIIASAHISTAMQGSTQPGEVDPKIRSLGIFVQGKENRRQPFTAPGLQIPKGMGDMNTDELLQKALTASHSRRTTKEISVRVFNRSSMARPII